MPEPTSAAMLLAGLGAAGFKARRRLSHLRHGAST
ncbi:PEP-CTERM sorting domain-containing protein [Rugamonas sp. CCM 8940]